VFANYAGRLSLLTFFGIATKVSCRRATPGSVAESRLQANKHAALQTETTAPARRFKHLCSKHLTNKRVF
jgi:hypothetical protein